MRRIVLAGLTAGWWLSGTDMVLGDCQTMAEAKAANPKSHLAYRLVAGAHCWFAGNPTHRAQAVAKRTTEQPARVPAMDPPDEAAPAQAPAEADTSHEAGEQSPARPESAQAPRRITEAFDSVEFDNNAAQSPAAQILGLSHGDVEVSETSEPTRQRVPPIRAATGYRMVAVWLLLTAGIATMLIAVAKFFRDRRNARLVRLIPSRQYARRRLPRDEASVATPLVHQLETRIFDRDAVFADASRGAPRSGTSRSLASLLRRNG